MEKINVELNDTPYTHLTQCSFILYVQDTLTCIAITYINTNDLTLSIDNIYTIKCYQGQGYCTKLLKYIISFCRDNETKKIILDDYSSKLGQQNNIYIKNGFKYICDGKPAMHIET